VGSDVGCARVRSSSGPVPLESEIDNNSKALSVRLRDESATFPHPGSYRNPRRDSLRCSERLAGSLPLRIVLIPSIPEMSLEPVLV
jgi:hypothetical protein